MSKPRRFDFSPDNLLAGVTGKLSVQDFGVYWMVCTLIYSKGGPVDDDHVWIARIFRDTHWRQIRASLDRLIASGKITATMATGCRQLMVKRCARELQDAGNRVAKAIHNANLRWKNNGLQNANASPPAMLLPPSPPPSPPKKERKKGQNGASAPPDDIKAKLFGPCAEWLASKNGGDAEKYKSVIGMWIRDYGEKNTLKAISEARRIPPFGDTVAYIQRLLNPPARKQPQI